jgi:hypothetical protein
MFSERTTLLYIPRVWTDSNITNHRGGRSDKGSLLRYRRSDAIHRYKASRGHQFLRILGNFNTLAHAIQSSAEITKENNGSIRDTESDQEH